MESLPEFGGYFADVFTDMGIKRTTITDEAIAHFAQKHRECALPPVGSPEVDACACGGSNERAIGRPGDTADVKIYECDRY